MAKKTDHKKNLKIEHDRKAAKDRIADIDDPQIINDILDEELSLLERKQEGATQPILVEEARAQVIYDLKYNREKVIRERRQREVNTHDSLLIAAGYPELCKGGE